MAQTIGSQDLDQNNKNTDQGQQQVGIFNGSPGNQENPGAPSSNQTSFNPNQQKGSGYTNIQKIVQANQGNRLGQAVGSGIQQAGQQTRSNLGQQQQQFQQQSAQNQANSAGNQQLVSNVLQNADQYDPTNQTNPNAQQTSQFQKLISGTYQGPQGLANTQQLQNQAQDVGQMAQSLNTAGGRVGLLQRFVGNPQYTGGQQSLDTLLLGQGGGNQAALAQARKATAGLGSQIANASAGAQAQGQEQANAAKEYGQQVQNQFGQTVADINTGLAQKATDAQATQKTNYDKMVSDLKSGNINQTEANLLGIGQNQVVTSNLLSNMDKYITQNPLAASAQNVASGQDYAKINALRSLAGQNASNDTLNTLQKYAGQDTHAGEFGKAPIATGDKSSFSNILDAQSKDYHNILDTPEAKYKEAQDIAMEGQHLKDQEYQMGAANAAYQAALNDNPTYKPGPFGTQIPVNPGTSQEQRAALKKQADDLTNQFNANKSGFMAKYPGAGGGSVAQQAQWAANNLAARGSDYNTAKEQIKQNYGDMTKFNIRPDEQ